jgi:hypothetical protein
MRVFRACVVLFALISPSAAAEPQSEAAKLAAKMRPGEWRELKSEGYDQETLMRGDDILAYSGKAAWSAPTRQVLFVGQVHLKGPPVFITYSADDNRWQRAKTPPWAEQLKWYHAYENNAADSEHGIFYVHQSDSRLVHRLDVAKNVWTTLPEFDAPTGHGTAIEYFPERRGLVRVLGGEVWFWSEEDKKWSRVAKDLELGPYHNVASYSAKAGVVLLGGGNDSRTLYKFDRDGKLSKCATAPVDLGIGHSLSIVDPASGELVVLAKGGQLYAFNVTHDKWRELPAKDLPFVKYTGHSISAAPLPDASAILFFSSRPQGMQTYLYKHAASD